MNNLIQKIEKKHIEELLSKKSIPAFRPGDTLKVIIKITEGDRSRLQAFEGVCISRKNNLVNSKFTVRKISHGEGVERVFPLFSPIIDKIEVVRKGNVKRAKLYYLRSRTGKRARIADQDRGEEADQYSMTEIVETSKDQNISDESIKENTKDLEEGSKIKEISEKSNDGMPNDKTTEPASKEQEPIEEKSELAASEADKTEDEPKS